MVRRKSRSGSNRQPTSHAASALDSGSARGPQRTGLPGDGQPPTAPDQPSSSAQTAPLSAPPVVSQQTIIASGTSTADSGGESSHVASSSSAAALAGDMENLTLQPPNPSSKILKVPRRPGHGTLGEKCVVRANHFLVKVASKSYFHYDVSISPEVTSKGVNRHIIKELIKLYKLSHLGNRMPAYDGKKSLYTAGPLPFESQEFKIILVDTNDASSSKRTGRERQFKVTIRYAAKGDLDHLQRFLQGEQLNCPQQIIQVLDVVLRTIPSSQYNVVGRSFFSTEFGEGDLGDGLVYWKGYYQSLRAAQLGLSLNIDLSATAFYGSIDVIDFVSKNFNFRHFLRPLQDHDRVKLKRALKGRRVTVTHLQNSRSYKIIGLSSQPVNKAMFSLDGQQTQISVFEYFKQKYNIVLKYPALPALQAGSDARPIYLPMELCKIVSGQKYNKKLNAKQVTNFLRATCERPSEREKNIKAVVQNAFGDRHDNRDLLVKTEFGISVKTDPVVIDARVLPAPKLLYKNPSGGDPFVVPHEGQWNMINKKFFDGGRVDAWACICFSNKIHSNIPHNFCAQLVDMCISKGMVFNRKPVIPITKCNPNQIEKALVDVHKETLATLAKCRKATKQIQLLIIILPDMSGSYGKIKRVCETELGIVSQCCQPFNASRLSKQYMENVALKINVKVGGRNTVLNDAITRNIPGVRNVPTIIFGADVTHPQPGDDSNPSIAAVVASMDWPEICKYRGLVSAQGHRDEIIQDLHKAVPDQKGSLTQKGMIRELLISFRKSTNRKPERIIFYRDGVSDGQFSHVLLYEMDAIRKACASLEEGYLPPVTFIVVQKRHHTRFFPARGSNMMTNGNIMPGTVVDTNICHPSEFDFYLNSHAGIQGTSRPAHYHVLFDENNFSADDLQMLTNALCFTFARCTRSVSVVPPAYYAHLAAFRARYYIEGDEEASDGRASASASGGVRLGRGGVGASPVEVRPLPAIKDTVKDVMFYC